MSTCKQVKNGIKFKAINSPFDIDFKLHLPCISDQIALMICQTLHGHGLKSGGAYYLTNNTLKLSFFNSKWKEDTCAFLFTIQPVMVNERDVKTPQIKSPRHV